MLSVTSVTWFQLFRFRTISLNSSFTYFCPFSHLSSQSEKWLTLEQLPSVEMLRASSFWKNLFLFIFRQFVCFLVFHLQPFLFPVIVKRAQIPSPHCSFFGLKINSGLKRKMFPHSALERRYSANEKKIGNQPDCPFFLENIKALKI